MLKAILFDLDHTLIDWSAFTGEWETSESKYLRGVFDYIVGQGFVLEDFKTFHSEYVRRTRDAWDQGRSNLRAPHLGKVLIETAESQGVPPGKLNMQGCLDAYKWGAVPGTRLFPDVLEALTGFRDQGIRMGIVTNAYQPMYMRDVELSHLGLLEFFPDCRISAADVGYLKPHPRIFEVALERLHVTADEAIFVGDNPIADIAGAQGAGLRAVMRVNQPMAPLISGLIIPDGAVNSLLELPFVLDELFAGG